MTTLVESLASIARLSVVIFVISSMLVTCPPEVPSL
jgi:hypothetical protein